MSFPGLRAVAAIACAAAFACASPLSAVQAQNSDQKSSEQGKSQSEKGGEAGKTETLNRPDEIAEAGQALTGAAANPECVWLGQRVVGLLWRDDLDTAFRHLDLYDRFGCPGNHVQVTFRCVVRQGNMDPKATETLNARVHSCWINPASLPAAAAAAAPSAQGAAGTNTR